jgi:DNA-binding NarL/FixJ family response regulator
MKAGAADYLLKDGLDAATLERAIRYVLERQRLLDELEEQSERLRRLATEAGAAEQRERRRLAQILHDHLQQLLVAAKMRAGQLHGTGHEKAERVGEQMTELLEEAIESARGLSHELYPAVLYDRGLAAAVCWLGQRYHEQHALEVEVDAEPGSGPEDQDLQAFLFQAVRELMLNAVKHGGADRVRIEMRRRDGVLTIDVEDNGAGCEPDQLFRPPESGGLGLFSIRERLNVLGGSMSARSARGEGCRIMLRMPVEDPADSEEPGESEREGRPVRVLLVDDHKIVRDGLAGILRAEPGIELVAEAADGREAVERVEEVRPDVIVMDVAMPRMDGTEATRVILRSHPQIRVIGLSMHQEQELAEAMREAGAVDYLNKAGASEELVGAIRQHAGWQAKG